MMLIIAAWVSICLGFAMALLQFSLVCGAPLGEFVLGGMHKVLPPKMRLLSGFYSCVFVLVGMSFLQVADSIAPILSIGFIRAILVVYSLFLAYAIIGNGFLTKSKKEKYVMTPISVIGSAASIVVLINVL